MSEKRCKTCACWSASAGERADFPGMRPCVSASIVDNSEGLARGWLSQASNMAAYADYEGYQALFLTGPEFGCVHHQEKDHAS